MSRKKGNRRENQAAKLYEDAGYVTERSVQANYGTRSDWFELFDIMAIRPGEELRFAQVKSNNAGGVREWFTTAETLVPPEVELDFLVCHDREGWRLLRPSDEHNYVTVLDERKTDVPMGESVRDYLEGDDAA